MSDSSSPYSPTANTPLGAGSATSVTVALIGNPNTGKSTLFNALAGVRQRTGNYPGVTVEKKEGRTTIGDRPFVIVDLPGTYSLAPRSPDEMIAVDVLLGRQRDVAPPDVVLCIVDASNLERNLYLVSQVLELGRPTVVALNMIDVAADKGVTLDLPRLAKQLGVPIVPIQAHRKVGIDDLKGALAVAQERRVAPPRSPFPESFQSEVARLEQLEREQDQPVLPRYLLERLILDTTGYLEGIQLPGVTPKILDEVSAARRRLAEQGLPVPGVEAMSRYQWVGTVLEGVVTRPAERRVTWSDRVDQVLTHRVAGAAIFVLVMILMFQSVFWVAEPASAGIDWAKGQISEWLEGQMSEGALRSLLINGVVEGVGGVLVFLPQIFTLFFFIAVLEDCGYMARAAYLMDRLMSHIGLSGKSFIPLLSSFACAIPGIMSTRVIENPRDRLVTILVAPLMSCSARLPVYTLLVGAFIPNWRYLGGWLGLQGLTIFAMYALGVVAAIGVALILKKTILRGVTPPFVMELPSYKIPGLGVVLFRIFERGWAFVRRAGTLIFAVSVVIWAAAYYPRNASDIDAAFRARHAALADRVAQLEQRLAAASAPVADSAVADSAAADGAEAADAKLTTAAQVRDELIAARDELVAADHELEGLYLRNSYLGRAGLWLEPLVRPLGWDWRIGCAAVASFPAREVVVATLGVIYNLGAEEEAESESLHATLRNATWEGTSDKVFNVPVALSIMVFFSLCAQCASTLAVMRRETNSWRWPLFTFAYMTTLAYVAALLTYQIGMLI